MVETASPFMLAPEEVRKRTKEMEERAKGPQVNEFRGQDARKIVPMIRDLREITKAMGGKIDQSRQFPSTFESLVSGRETLFNGGLRTSKESESAFNGALRDQGYTIDQAKEIGDLVKESAMGSGRGTVNGMASNEVSAQIIAERLVRRGYTQQQAQEILRLANEELYGGKWIEPAQAMVRTDGLSITSISDDKQRVIIEGKPYIITYRKNSDQRYDFGKLNPSDIVSIQTGPDGRSVSISEFQREYRMHEQKFNEMRERIGRSEAGRK